MEPRDHTIGLDGLAFHYVEWGRAEARPLVLLHGLTGHARVWDHLAGALSPHYRLIALDQRGHGDSEAPRNADYGTGTMAGDLAAFVDRLSLERFTLLGHSMGGRVAIAYAGDHPARVERLILVDIGPDIHLPGRERVRQMMADAPERIESEEWAVEYVRRAYPLADLAQLRHRVRHGLKRLPDGTLAWKYDKGLRDMMRQGTRDGIDLWEPVHRIPCPTLLVRGSESDIITAEMARKAVEAFPDGLLIEIERAGHTVPGDRPEEFARAVREFLEA